MVSVNMPAIVSPTFVPDASPIGLIPGDNSPFTYVSWDAMQSMVVSTGVTFAVQAVEIGANQVAIPIGDATFVTCGPFECAMGMDAPEISIANSAQSARPGIRRSSSRSVSSTTMSWIGRWLDT